MNQRTDDRNDLEKLICDTCLHQFGEHDDCHRCSDDREMRRRQMAAKELPQEYRGVKLGDVYSQTRRRV